MTTAGGEDSPPTPRRFLARPVAVPNLSPPMCQPSGHNTPGYGSILPAALGLLRSSWQLCVAITTFARMPLRVLCCTCLARWPNLAVWGFIGGPRDLAALAFEHIWKLANIKSNLDPDDLRAKRCERPKKLTNAMNVS